MTALIMSPVRVSTSLEAVGVRIRAALANIRYLPLRRRYNVPDAANALWAEYLAYRAESHALYQRAEGATTEAERVARYAEYNAFDEPNALPRFFGIVDAIEALPPTLNAAAARLMREAVAVSSRDEPLNGPELEHVTFTLKALLPFLSGVIAECAQDWIVRANEGDAIGETRVWH